MTEKTTAAKLQIKDGNAVYFVGRDDAAALVGELPPGALPVADPARATVAVIFVADRAELDDRAADLRSLTSAKAVWFCYAKGNATNINRDSMRDALAPADWETIANVSVDATWSALRVKFVS